VLHLAQTLGLTNNIMPNLRPRILITLFAMFVVAGCGGVPIAEVKAALAAAKPCCSGFESVAYIQLSAGNRTKVELTTSSPALKTSEGLAYFAAFRLTEGVSRLEVQALNTPYLPKATYPDPLLVFLDSQHRRITEIKDLPLVRSRHAILPGLFEYHYGAVVNLPVETQYVLVFARPDSERSQSAVSDAGKQWTVQSAPVGTFAVVPR
jgi:hypothetical protein